MVHCFPGWNFTLSGFLCLQRPLASRDSFYLSSTESAGSVRLLLPRLVKTTAPACLAPLVTSLRFTFLRAVCRLPPDTAARGRGGGGVVAALCLRLSKNFRGLNVVIVAMSPAVCGVLACPASPVALQRGTHFHIGELYLSHVHWMCSETSKWPC